MDRRQRIEQLFHEVLALEPSARTRFLAEACATDSGLLEEVTELISAHEQIDSFIDRPAYHGLALDDDLSDSLIGTSLGRYRVIRLIKRSGMGEVYLARDTHLPRDVALKLLPLMFTGDENRLRRFILEAESASSLNHPNILTIYEIGHIDDVHYIATEFVDGQTLRERLSDGPLELDEALEIALGVTNALVASHAAGIVHRDIKPENIMIRRDGYVKVLDFGLAKLTEGPDVRVNSNISRIHTDPGTFMGTVGYLSPEQSQSLEVDTRSDVFSLGVVIYEMITGQNPFNREALSEVIDAILKTESLPLTKFAPNAPTSLQKIVTRALSKDKLDRYQQTEDLLTDLKAVQAQIQPRKLTPGDRRRRLAIGLVAIMVIAFLCAAILRVLNKSRGANSVSDLSARLRFSEIQSWKSERGEGGIDARFSHDSQMIAFTRLKNGLDGIWVKQAVSGAEPRLIIADPSGNNWPIWSPGDDRIAFFSYREDKVGIWSSSIGGGPPQFLGPIKGAGVRLKCWSKDGRTIYYDSANNLYGFDVSTGVVTQLTKFQKQSSYRNFSLAPNEDRIAYVGVQNGQTDIWVASLNGEGAFKVTNDAEVDRTPLWHPDSKRIVYTSNRGGAFQVFVAYVDGTNPIQITVSGEEHVITDISRDGGRLLKVSSQDNAEIFGVDTDSGREFELTSGSGLMLWPEVSRDGRLITFQSTNATEKIASNSTIFVKRSTGEGPMISVAANGFGPTWSPDDRQILFLRFAGGQADIYSVSSSGENERRLTTGGVGMNGYYLLPATKYGHNFCWLPDGDAIVYTRRVSDLSDLWSVNVDGSNQKSLSANTNPKQFVYEPVCGPDGRISFAAENREGSSTVWSLWVRDKDTTKLLLETKSLLRPIAWLSGDELLAAYSEEEGSISQGYPVPVKLIRVSRDGQRHTVGTLESTYFWTVHLATDGRTIAFISDKDKSDNIWLTDISGTLARKLTSNKEPKLFFPNLNWSSDGKTIYFGKQSSVGLITMIENLD